MNVFSDLRAVARYFLLAMICSVASSVQAAESAGKTEDKGVRDVFDQGKLLATGGVGSISGAGGGGLTPWALITGYGSDNGIGVNAHLTHLNMPDYRFTVFGAAAGFYDRFELSYGRQWFDTGPTGVTLGLGDGYTFHQHIFGAKVRLFGDAVYDQDRWMPQVAAGVQYKYNDSRHGSLTAIGAKDKQGIDYYLSATKLLLAESLLVNGTVRATRANQVGLFGFGGDKDDDYGLEFEGAVAYLLSRQWVVGAEYRTKPDNLSFAREDDWWDLFAAYFINKNLSVTVAYADLGSVAVHDGQRGIYVSVQAGF